MHYASSLLFYAAACSGRSSEPTPANEKSPNGAYEFDGADEVCVCASYNIICILYTHCLSALFLLPGSVASVYMTTTTTLFGTQQSETFAIEIDMFVCCLVWCRLIYTATNNTNATIKETIDEFCRKSIVS